MDRNHLKMWMVRGATVLLFLVIAVSAFYLPSALSGHVASPDERAFMVMVERLRTHQPLSIDAPDAVRYPWLHPRSWVSQGVKIVPVGFLGVPLLLAPSWFFPLSIEWLSVLATLIILSSSIPLYLLLKRSFGREAAFLGVGVSFLFPTWIYYTNRSLFADGLQLSLLIWSLFMTQLPSVKAWLRSMCFGFLAGVAASLRPFELLWMAPVLIWWGRREKVGWSFAFLGFVLGCLPSVVLAQQVYGSPFVVGYLLHDNINLFHSMDDLFAITLQDRAESVFDYVGLFFTGLGKLFPYGLHPLNVLRNIWAFGVKMLWPYVLLVLALIGFDWKKHEELDWVLVGVLISTGLVLLLVYGSGLYQDNVTGAATIGNSFLRYLMPFGLVMGLAAAYGYQWFDRKSVRSRWVVLCVFCMAFGWWTAFFRDAEGLVPLRSELQRYDMIAAEAKRWFSSEDVIVSPRSDKIFFPEFLVASPMPDRTEIVRYLKDKERAHPEAGMGLLDRTLTDVQVMNWRSYGVNVTLLETFGNESLYRLSL